MQYICKYVIWYQHIRYHRNTHTYVYLTHKTWPHNLECIVIILTQCQSNYGDLAHDFRTWRKFFFSNFGVVVGWCMAHHATPHHHPKTQTWFWNLEHFPCQTLWWCWWEWGLPHYTTPHHRPKNSNMIFGLRKCQLGRIGTYLCISVCACACTCVYAHMHIHGGGPWPPTPHKNFKPNSYYKQSYSPLCFLM